MWRPLRGAAAALPAAVLLAAWQPAAATVEDIVALDELLPGPFMVEADPEKCTWPTCTKHRVLCDTKKVGTCIAYTISPDLPGCINKHAVCGLGRCNCPKDYCAREGSKKCKPQIVYEGARPPAMEQGIWLRTFVSLGHPDQFPRMWQLWQSSFPGMRLISPWCLPAVLLLLVGLVIACITAAVMCNNLFQFRCCQRHDDSTNLIVCGIEFLDNEEPERHTHRREPSCWPVAALVLLVLVCSAWTVVAREHNWGITTDYIDHTMTRMKSNSVDIAAQSVRLNSTVSGLIDGFQNIADCKDNPVMSMIGNLAVNSTAGVSGVVGQLQDSVKDIPDQADAFKEELAALKFHAVWLPCIPLILMSILAALMLAEVLFARHSGSAKTAHYEDQGLVFCAGLFVLLIILVAAASAAMLSILIGVGQICRDIDANVVEYVEQVTEGWNGTAANCVDITKFYVQGDVFNPLFGYTEQVHIDIDTIVGFWEEYTDLIVKPQSLSCKAVGDIDMDNIYNVSKDLLGTMQQLLNATNVYPYYKGVVHDGICNHMAGSFGLYWLQQLLVGLVFFPLCAMATHSYLAHHVGVQQMKGGGGSESAESEDSPDGVELTEDEAAKLF